MPKQTHRKVLVDTSFLITLFNRDRENHIKAKKYYIYFIQHEIDMYLSTIAISEYSQKASIEPILATNNFIPLTFTVPDSIISGQFSEKLKDEKREPSEKRDVVKDDVKMLAQCANGEFDYLVTDDRSTMARWASKLHDNGDLKTQVIPITEYDESVFNNGQTTLDFTPSNE